MNARITAMDAPTKTRRADTSPCPGIDVGVGIIDADSSPSVATINKNFRGLKLCA